MSTTAPTSAPALTSGAVYFGDNGRAMCADCAGHTARHTGHDLSGQRLIRATVDDAREWAAMCQDGSPDGPLPAEMSVLGCECGNVRLTAISGQDGWPLVATA